MPRPVHFYHIWRAGNWQEIAAEHFSILKESGFDGEIFRCEIDSGFEDITLNRLRDFCLTADPNTPVLYAHAKGSFRKMYLRDAESKHVYPQDMQELWRGGMTDRLVRCWQCRVEDLRSYDIAGCHWIASSGEHAAHFAGNFWWARAGYVATLPALPVLDDTNRWEAEWWIGSGNPRVMALSEGFSGIPMPPTPGAKAVEWLIKTC